MTKRRTPRTDDAPGKAAGAPQVERESPEGLAALPDATETARAQRDWLEAVRAADLAGTPRPPEPSHGPAALDGAKVLAALSALPASGFDRVMDDFCKATDRPRLRGNRVRPDEYGRLMAEVRMPLDYLENLPDEPHAWEMAILNYAIGVLRRADNREIRLPDAAKLTGYSDETLRRYVAAGKLSGRVDGTAKNSVTMLRLSEVRKLPPRP